MKPRAGLATSGTGSGLALATLSGAKPPRTPCEISAMTCGPSTSPWMTTRGVKAAAARVTAEDGKLDVLIANAGISGSYAHPTEQSIDEIRQVYEVNVFGTIRLIQAFTPLLKAAGSAAIVNVSSELGSLGSLSDPQGEFYGVNILGYNSSKTALNAATVSFAKALAPFNIRVNSADPGYTATDFNGHTGYRTVEQAAEIIVQLATSEDAGQTGKFLNDRRVLPW